MPYGAAEIVEDLTSIELEPDRSVIYDRDIESYVLHQDPNSGAKHYLIRYPAGLQTRLHRHTSAHTVVVLEGRLEANDRVVGPGSYCHFPPGETMRHQPAGDDSCLFLIVFHGPVDVEPLDE